MADAAAITASGLDGAGPAPVPTSPLRRLLFALAVLGLLSALCTPLFVNHKARNAPRATAGTIDYRGWGPLSAPVDLAGQWRFTWYGGAPQQGPPRGTGALVHVPGVWAGQKVGGAELPDNGAARYELRLRNLPSGSYVLHVPIIFSANRVSVDGRVVSEQGRIGIDPASTSYHFRSHEIPIEVTRPTLDIRIDIASYHHRDNGMEAAPVFGTNAAMREWITLQWAQAFLYVTVLMLLAAYGLVVFFFRPKDRASLYFALACIGFLPTAAIFRYDNLVLIAFPGMSFPAMLAIMYLGGIAAICFYFAYVTALFPGESPRWITRAIIAVFGLLAAWQGIAFLLGDTLGASYTHQYCLGFASLTLLYSIGVVLLATVRGRNGAVVFLLGMGIFIATFIIGTVVAAGWLPRDRVVGVDLQAIGVLMMLFSHIIILAERWSISIEAAEQTNQDLRRLLDINTLITTEMRLDALLQKIVRVTTDIIHADRSSLFLYDDKTDELWSLVAEGVGTREIRFHSETGLAGHCFTTGCPVNVPDAYVDERFNPALDRATGYRTRSILTVPIVARDGRRLGVMQALNRHDGRPFDDSDVARICAFAAQAAVAIDNAKLFSEVISSRNYNDSILRSMSSGVVTLDKDVQAATINAAASRILGLSQRNVEGRDAREFIGAGNPEVLAEIDAVNESGQPRTLLDIDVMTGRGEAVACNLSIVPLMGEGEQVGTLIIIEDISEGKRIQGAMRRFMTQEVVDQVLARQDDMLFGTACDASILFADIRNFTSLAEKLQPRETVDMLNEVFTDLFEAVAESDGVLDKFIGDAIMAVYGAPLSTGRDAENAVASGVQMLHMLAAINERKRGLELPELRLGVGVATGEVVAGTIGSPKRMDYTVIGDSVNLASRLQDLTKPYGVGIIICERSAAAVRREQRLRELDVIRVKGRTTPAKIFEVIPDAANGAAQHWDDLCGVYQRGREAMAAQRWREATRAFNEAVRVHPGDGPSSLMLERIRILSRNAPGADWDGVWTATSK